jgi:hypothetical protein
MHKTIKKRRGVNACHGVSVVEGEARGEGVKVTGPQQALARQLLQQVRRPQPEVRLLVAVPVALAHMLNDSHIVTILSRLSSGNQA